MEEKNIREIRAEEAKKEKKGVKAKVKNALEKGTEIAEAGWDWVGENWIKIAFVTGIVGKWADSYNKVRGCHTRAMNAQYRSDRDLSIYDRRTNQRYYLKREMRAYEKLEFRNRLERGEDVGDILDDMNLLRW